MLTETTVQQGAALDVSSLFADKELPLLNPARATGGGSFSVRIEEGEGIVTLEDGVLKGGLKAGSAKIVVSFQGDANLEDAEWTVTVTNEIAFEIYTAEGDDPASPSRKNYTTLEEAIAEAKREGKTVYLNGEAGASGALEIAGTDSVVLKQGDKAEMPAAIRRTADGALFTVAEGGSLGLEGVVLKNSLEECASPFLLSQGTVTLNNVSFEGGEAGGGTVDASGAGAKLVCGGNVTFSGLRSANGAVCLADGAQMEGDGSLEFSRCTSENGGALNVKNAAVNAESVSLHFADCTAEGDGGAILLAEGARFTADRLSVESCVAANGKGGALCLEKGATVTLGENARVFNNAAKTGSGVYVADGAVLGLSAAADVSDGITIGYDAALSGMEERGRILLDGAPEDGKTLVIEFENAAMQVSTADGADLAEKPVYVTSKDDALTSSELKAFMRVKNAGYTFGECTQEKAGTEHGLYLMNSGAIAAVVLGDGGWENSHAFTDVQDAIDYLAENGQKGTVYLTQYRNSADPALDTNEILLSETLVVPAGTEVTFASAVREADGEGAVVRNNDNNWAKPGDGFGSENYGGGIRNEGNGNFTMTGGAVRDCYSREGGAIMNVNKPGAEGYAEAGHPVVNIEGGELSGNVAQQKGAAIQSIYGGAETNVKSGADIRGNWSLNDLGTLAVEEGASLAISGGTVAAGAGNLLGGERVENKIAVYLYNRYAAEDVAAADA